MSEFQIIEGECLEVMASMEPQSVGCIVADPPYTFHSASSRTLYNHPWADMMNASLWFERVLREMRRVLRPEGAAWMFTNWRCLPTVVKASCDAEWKIKSVLTWYKAWPGTGNYLRTTSEMVCLFTGDEFKMPRHDLHDVQTFKPVPTGRRLHSAQKPVDLLEFLMEAVKADGVVLDPFCGSGSTGEAAINRGLEFVGIEANRDMCEVARERLESC